MGNVTTKAALEILREARALIAKKKTWTQGRMARDAEGKGVISHSSHAVCYCSAGAMHHTRYLNERKRRFLEAYRVAYYALHDAMDYCVTAFNDSHTHKTVLKRWDKAIDNLEATVKDAAA